MLLALRREEEVAVDLVEIAAVDMEEEETDTAEEVAGEAAVMVRDTRPSVLKFNTVESISIFCY